MNSSLQEYLDVSLTEMTHDILRCTTRNHTFSNFLNAVREDLTSNDIIQHVKNDLQKILAWFIINFFSHNIDLFAQARKKF